MREQRITGRGESINLGYCGEDNNTIIRFDIPADWDAEMTTLRVTRKGEESSPYVPTGFAVEDGVGTWTVSSVDTGIEGEGEAQLCMIVGDRIAKSRKYKTVVGDSIDDVTVPEPERSVLDYALEQAAKYKDDAAQSAQDAQTAQEAA